MTPEEREVAEAIKALRAQLGESQQQFSNRLGVVVRTVARWELEQPPKGDVLLRLFDLSQEVGREDLMRVFAKALNKLPPKVLLESIRSLMWPVMTQNIRAWAQMEEALLNLEKTAGNTRSKPDDYRSQIAALRKKTDLTRKQIRHLAALIGVDITSLSPSTPDRHSKAAKADE